MRKECIKVKINRTINLCSFTLVPRSTTEQGAGKERDNGAIGGKNEGSFSMKNTRQRQPIH